MFTYPKYAIGDGFTTLALLFLGDEDFVDQHAQKACEGQYAMMHVKVLGR